MVFPLFCGDELKYYDENPIIHEDILNNPKYAPLIDSAVLERNKANIALESGRLRKIGWCAFRESMLISAIIVIVILALWYFSVNEYTSSFVDALGVWGSIAVIFGTIVIGIAGGYDMFNIWLYKQEFHDIFQNKYEAALNDELNNTNQYTKLSPLQIHTKAVNEAVAESRFEDMVKPQPSTDFIFFFKMMFAAFATGAAVKVVTSENFTVNGVQDKVKKIFSKYTGGK